MLKQYSQINLTQKEIDALPVDTLSFYWTDREIGSTSFTACILVELNNNYYSVSNFKSNSGVKLLYKVYSKEEALKLSIFIYPTSSITLVEWLNIYKLCVRYNLNLSSLFDTNPFPMDIIYIEKLFDKFLSFPDVILNYLSKKNASWRTLRFLSILDKNNLLLIEDYLNQCTPSVQEFRIFIEKITDFRDKLLFTKYDKYLIDKITDKRFPTKKLLEEQIIFLNKRSPNVFFANKNFFEDSKLEITLSIKSYSSYLDSIVVLENLKSEINKYFKLFFGS